MLSAQLIHQDHEVLSSSILEQLLIYSVALQVRRLVYIMGTMVMEAIINYHSHDILPRQCASINMQEIPAPISHVWSLIRRFDFPQSYKCFIKECCMRAGNGTEIGSVREVLMKSELPAVNSIERLDELDDEHHVMRFSSIGGDHRLTNYQSTISLHQVSDKITTVIESYVVDVPPGVTREDTRTFIDGIIKFSLKSLAERMADCL
ncbi:putative polyketide cyclase/dehydrase, START-like domain superfamily [Dioscorea sansibarensis]